MTDESIFRPYDPPTQQERLLELLIESFPEGLSAMEILRRGGIYRAAARVSELRKRGWLIETKTEHGKTAVYRLTSLTNIYWKPEQKDLGL
jgi:hypothetical protein